MIAKNQNQIFIILSVLRRSVCVTSGVLHLRDIAPGQHGCKEMLQRWQADVDTVPI